MNRREAVQVCLAGIGSLSLPVKNSLAFPTQKESSKKLIQKFDLFKPKLALDLEEWDTGYVVAPYLVYPCITVFITNWDYYRKNKHFWQMIVPIDEESWYPVSYLFYRSDGSIEKACSYVDKGLVFYNSRDAIRAVLNEHYDEWSWASKTYKHDDTHDFSQYEKRERELLELITKSQSPPLIQECMTM